MPTKTKAAPDAAPAADTDDAIRHLVYQSCRRLDQEDFAAYMQLCTKDFQYRIVAYSPDLRRDMVWLDHDHAGMVAMFDMIPKHVRLEGTMLRHATVYDIRWTKKGMAEAFSPVQILYTDLAGASRLFAVGEYQDTIVIQGGVPKLKERVVRLQTRDLGPGSHLPM